MRGQTERDKALRFVPWRERNAARVLDRLAAGLEIDLPFTPGAVADSERAAAPAGVDPELTDLTRVPLVTIDGADARDFDDAVCATALGNGAMRLIVAIADVSHYVQEGGAIDRDALIRCCSVYLPGRVYPMLPPRLADDLCSLRPGELRRCAWVEMTVVPDGRIVAWDVGFGVMRSRARLTYEQVQRFLDGGNSPWDDEVSASLVALEDVFRRLHRRRRDRGMLDLELPEMRVRLTPDASAVDSLDAAPRLDAHRLIEECMLAANETVANFLATRGWPAILRVHDEPDPARVQEVRTIADAAGFRMSLSPTPRVQEIDAALASVAGTPHARVLSWLILRSMPKALYTVEDRGHFGIGAGRYLHFTSPIRRYADLAVHRMLRSALRGQAPRGSELRRLAAHLAAVAQACNRGEEVATVSERLSDRLLRALFMLPRVGETFDGIVSDVAAFGAFVSVTDPFLDGLIPIRSVGREFFRFDEAVRRLRGDRSGREVGIGDHVVVRCVAIDPREGRISFDLVNHWRAQLPAALAAPAVERAVATRRPRSKRPPRAPVSAAAPHPGGEAGLTRSVAASRPPRDARRANTDADQPRAARRSPAAAPKASGKKRAIPVPAPAASRPAKSLRAGRRDATAASEGARTPGSQKAKQGGATAARKPPASREVPGASATRGRSTSALPKKPRGAAPSKRKPRPDDPAKSDAPRSSRRPSGKRSDRAGTRPASEGKRPASRGPTAGTEKPRRR